MIVKYIRIPIISFIMLNLIIFSAYGGDLESRAGQHYLKGKRYYEDGQYNNATDEFQKALSILNSEREAMPSALRPLSVVGAEKQPAPEKIEDIEVVRLKGEEVLEYYIEVDDVLDISVWRVDELSKPEVLVRPDGRISFPLIGDVRTAGLTLTQLDDIITEKLKVYVNDPQVSIMIRKFGGKKAIVLGEVNSPGVYSYSGNIRLIELIALAGDFSRHAVRKNVVIIRGGRDNPQPILVNAQDIIRKANLRDNLFIQSQDIVYIPRSLIGNLNTFLSAITPTLDTVYMGSITKGQLETALESD